MSDTSGTLVGGDAKRRKTEEEGKQKLKGHLHVHNPCPRVEQLMFGGGAIGCLFKDVKPEAAKACVERALEVGIRYVDTAPWYGAGLSETRLGEYLACRDDILVSTKCGRLVVSKAELDPQNDRIEKGYDEHFYTDKYHMNRVIWSYTGEGIRESVTASCKRLKLKSIHCLRLHDAENEERYKEATAPGGAVDTMIALKAEGKVKEISLGMNSAEFITRYLAKYPGKFDNIMLSNSFNLIDHSCLNLLVECQEQGIKITNVGVFASGVLWGGNHYLYGNVPESVKQICAKWTVLAEKHGLSLPQVALNFAFLPKIVNYVAFGTSRAEAVDQNVALCGKTVPVSLWKEAKESGLIDSRLPLPEP